MAADVAPLADADLPVTIGSARARLVLSILLTVIPLAFLILLVRRCVVDVPFWDEWEMVPRIQRLHDGTFTYLDLWAQHNEHRPLFGIAAMLLLVQLTSWNVAAEVAANVLIGVMIFGIFAVRVSAHWPVRGGAPLWLLPVLSLLAFSPNQWENWLWGWQVTLFINGLSVCAGLALLSRLEGRWLRLAGASICGIVATYSFAAGLVFWFSGTLSWWLNKEQRNRAQMLVWAVVAAVTIASYFYDYHFNPAHPSMRANFASVEAFALYLVYVAKYAGAGVAPFNPLLAAIAGGAGVVLFAWLALSSHRQAGHPVVGFAILVGFHCVAVGLMTGLGRAGFGTDQGLASRYVTISTPLWLAVSVLAAVRLSQLRLAGGRSRWRSAESGLISATTIAIVISVVASGERGTRLSSAHHDLLVPARRALITGQDNGLLGRLYPDAAVVRERREALIAWHLSVFRSARAQREP